jgi:hypothetical protein
MKCEGGICFHGAFNRKVDAERKARQRGGKVRLAHVGPGRRSARWIVVTKKKG